MQVFINCPECNTIIVWRGKGGICQQGHSFVKESGVFQVLDKDQKMFLEAYLPKFNLYRNDSKQKINADNINQLPFVDFDSGIWKLRRNDLTLISKYLTATPMKILDIGAWNGWLSHQLVKKGHEVMAIDYFIAPFDGLQSVNYYEHKFTAVQMSPLNIGLIDNKFNLIIINRCLSYICRT